VGRDVAAGLGAMARAGPEADAELTKFIIVAAEGGS
jgi:hypothetical protein